jgi:hypothetical protein
MNLIVAKDGAAYQDKQALSRTEVATICSSFSHKIVALEKKAQEDEAKF